MFGICSHYTMSILDNATMARHLEVEIALAPALTLDHVQHGDRKVRRLAIAAMAESLVARLQLAGVQAEPFVAKSDGLDLPFYRH